MQEDEPRTLSALAGLCIKLDQRLFDQGKRDGNRTGLSTVPVIKVKNANRRDWSHPPSSIRSGTPFQRPSVAPSRSPGPASRPRGPLTPAERDERMRLGLCLACGDKGHIRDNCPKRRDYGTTTVNAYSEYPESGNGRAPTRQSGQSSA